MFPLDACEIKSIILYELSSQKETPLPKILPNLHEEILMVGRDLLDQSGYQEFSMRAVAARCGIGVGTLYNYFPSKQQMVAAILRSDWEVHLRRMAQIARQGTPERERLLGLYGELCAFMRGKHNMLMHELPQSMDCDEVRGALAQRSVVRGQIVDTVASVLVARPESQREWLADCISRLLMSYSAGAEDHGQTIQNILDKLLA